MKKRIMSFLLALVMVCSLIPMMTTTASATEYSSGQTAKFTEVAIGDRLLKGARLYDNRISGILCVVFWIGKNQEDPNKSPDYISSWTADDNYQIITIGRVSMENYSVILRRLSKVTFNANGGTTPTASTLVCQYDSKYTYGTLPTPTRAGYTFDGWYTSASGGSKVTSSTTVTNGSDHTLYAHWTPHSITFRYHPNGGVGQPDNYVTWTAEADDTFPDSHWNYANSGDAYYMTRHGYTATGDYAKADGSCSYHQDENFTSYADLCAKYGVNINTKSTTIDIYAQWSPNNYTVNFDANGGTAVDSITAPYESNITLPTPTKAGHRFGGWQGNLKDIVTLTKGMEINDTSKGTIGENAGYAVTEYLVPVVGGATYTSNYEVCGLYSFDANGNFIKRESSYATTHTVSSNAAFVRVEVNISKGISFEEYQNNLTLTYTVPGGTTFRVGGNQTLTAQWSVATYTVTWKNYDGSVLETDTGVTYNSTPSYNGTTPVRAEDESFTYTFKGWSPTVSAVTDDIVYTAEFTATSKRVEPTYTVTIPATAKVGEEITISATDVVLNEDETLTVTLQSDFKLYMGQDVALPFVINSGSIQNNAVILSITGNGDQTAPQTAESTPLTVTPAEDPPYAGTYTGTIHFTIAVTTAGNN